MSAGTLAGLSEPAALGIGSRRTIPFDIAFRFDLSGKPGRVLRKVATVSIEATFTAVSIGYGVVPTVTPLTFGPTIRPNQLFFAGPGTTILNITLGEIITGLSAAVDDIAPTGSIGARAASVLENGVKLNPVFAAQALGTATGFGASLDGDAISALFQAVAAPPDRIQFRYALFDDGTGREFQSEPILNIAGLGSADGDRPFRYFAQPITFRPRSTIRLEITELSEFEGELHVSLQGFKTLGGAGSPTERAVQRAARNAGALPRRVRRR